MHSNTYRVDVYIVFIYIFFHFCFVSFDLNVLFLTFPSCNLLLVWCLLFLLFSLLRMGTINNRKQWTRWRQICTECKSLCVRGKRIVRQDKFNLESVWISLCHFGCCFFFSFFVFSFFFFLVFFFFTTFNLVAHSLSKWIDCIKWI